MKSDRPQPGARAGPPWDWARTRRACLLEARRLLRHPDDAEEAVQEALIRAWRSWESCDAPEAPLAWILQIARNESFRLQERRKRRRERECPGTAREPFAEDPQIETMLGEVAVETVLAQLPREDRVLIRLRYFADLSQPEVARRLDVPEGTVKVRLHRARARLHRLLTEAT